MVLTVLKSTEDQTAADWHLIGKHLVLPPWLSGSTADTGCLLSNVSQTIQFRGAEFLADTSVLLPQSNKRRPRHGVLRNGDFRDQHCTLKEVEAVYKDLDSTLNFDMWDTYRNLPIIGWYLV